MAWADWKDHFHRNRFIALGTGLVAVVIGWFSAILMTNPAGNARPDAVQLTGLAVAVALGVGSWLKRCFTILPHDLTVPA